MSIFIVHTIYHFLFTVIQNVLKVNLLSNITWRYRRYRNITWKVPIVLPFLMAIFYFVSRRADRHVQIFTCKYFHNLDNHLFVKGYRLKEDKNYCYLSKQKYLLIQTYQNNWPDSNLTTKKLTFLNFICLFTFILFNFFEVFSKTKVILECRKSYHIFFEKRIR